VAPAFFEANPVRALVTGGAGFIGSHLCDALLERGHEVTCVDNLVGSGGSTRNVAHLDGHPSFRLVTEDFVEWVTRADLRGTDCIFHLAASKNSVCRADPERDLLVNALGTLRLARAAQEAGVRKLVHASTGSVFGEVGTPVSYYGVSKLAGESYVPVVSSDGDLDWTILRFYHVIGPRQDDSAAGGVVPIFVRQALRGEPLTIDGDGGQTRVFTSVYDAVRAALIAMEHPGSRRATLTCASGVRVTVRELADYVIERTGSRGGAHHGPPRPGDIRHFEVDNGQLRSLGLEFDTEWQAVVRDVIAFSVGRAAA
jgi:UDP-glucose 4-epimerase